MADKKEYPKMIYGPGAQQRVIVEGEKAPSGWKDHPSKVKDDEPQPSLETGRIAELEAEVAALQAKIEELQSQDAKTSAAEGKKGKPSAKDEKEAERKRFREEAIKTLREMGVEMDDSATDAELDAALNKVGR